MHQVPARVSPLGIVMGPMNHAALVIPCILAEEGHLVPCAETVEPGRDVDIVGYEYE